MNEKKLITLGRDGKLMLLGSDGREEPVPAPERQRQGTVYLLVDCSWSMEGESLNQARRGADEFVSESLKKGYAAGLISFDSEALLLVPRSRARADFSRPLEALTAKGSTNMTAGLKLAASALALVDGRRSVVVVSDGIPDDKVSAMEAARALSSSGVQIITIATESADKEFLASIATASELASVVKQTQLQNGIADAALQLPWLSDD